MRSDIRPGGIFPDYALPDQTGTVRRLSELQGRDPLILTLARGNYCPKEHRQHLELAEHYPEIAVAYTQVATIATDDHHTLQEFRASTGAQWPFLSDPGRTVQKDLDIKEYTDPEHDPMIPHTLVLNRSGAVINITSPASGRGGCTHRLSWGECRDELRLPRRPPPVARRGPPVPPRPLSHLSAAPDPGRCPIIRQATME